MCVFDHMCFNVAVYGNAQAVTLNVNSKSFNNFRYLTKEFLPAFWNLTDDVMERWIGELCCVVPLGMTWIHLSSPSYGLNSRIDWRLSASVTTSDKKDSPDFNLGEGYINPLHYFPNKSQLIMERNLCRVLITCDLKGHGFKKSMT